MATSDAQRLQRQHLTEQLSGPMGRLSGSCAAVWEDPPSVDQLLSEHLGDLPRCRLLYALDAGGIQCSANILAEGAVPGFRGQDLSRRPFWQEALPAGGLALSPVYLDRNDHTPCITAVAPVRYGPDLLGYLAADFALYDLALPAPASEPHQKWTQFRGDPAIRDTLFLQHRASTHLEREMDAALRVVQALFTEGGIFHAKIHFSASRVTLWPTADPFRYRVHTVTELLDPDLFLDYPPPDGRPCAQTEADTAGRVLERFKALRCMDDTLYLRSGSLNTCNGLVGINFSCDGTHYMGVQEFLEKGQEFWVGKEGACL
ncbi:MAG TPA: PDC sensor domain-containing protein [Gammaproteobacteria bacterium]|nr:PDC sensor domain-containing protein [Gammaproteobacteria bacterium]